MTERRKRTDHASAAVAEVQVPALKPSQCRAYLRQQLAREFPEIVQGFVAGAKKGSCQHVKLATELVGATERKARPRARQGESVVRSLIEELEAEGG